MCAMCVLMNFKLPHFCSRINLKSDLSVYFQFDYEQVVSPLRITSK